MARDGGKAIRAMARRAPAWCLGLLALVLSGCVPVAEPWNPLQWLINGRCVLSGGKRTDYPTTRPVVAVGQAN